MVAGFASCIMPMVLGGMCGILGAGIHHQLVDKKKPEQDNANTKDSELEREMDRSPSPELEEAQFVDNQEVKYASITKKEGSHSSKELERRDSDVVDEVSL
jgi:hypothetical protein